MRADQRPSRGERISRAIVLAGVVALAAVTWRQQAGMAAEARLPQWDEAVHGLHGVQLADAARHGDIVGFVTRVHEMSLWPPFFPLMETPVFLLFGYEYGVARAFMTILFFFTVLLVFHVGVELRRSGGVIVGAVAAGLMCASPMFFFHGLYVMLELPTALLSLLAALLYLRYLRTEDRRLWIAWCVSIVCLFFTKYNYALLMFLPAAANELWRDRGFRSDSLGRAKRFLTGGGLTHPLSLITIVFLVFAGSIVLTGGWIVHPFGHRVSVRSAGNPTFIYIAIVLVGFLVRPRRNGRRLRAAVAGQDPRVRDFLLIVALPVFLWLLHPHHVKNMFIFLENRNPGVRLLDPDNLLFYPRAFLESYSPGRGIGMAVLALAAIAAPLLARDRGPGRYFLLTMLVVAILPVLHPLKKPRYFFDAPPFLWIAAGVSIAWIAGIGLRLVSERGRALAAALVALVVLAGLGVAGRDRGVADGMYRHWTGSPGLRPMLDVLARECRSAPGTVVLGFYGRLGPELAAWHGYLVEPGFRRDREPVPAETLERTRRPGPLLDAIAGREGRGRVVVLRLLEPNPENDELYRSDTDWLPAARAALRADPRFRFEWGWESPYSLRAIEVYARRP